MSLDLNSYMDVFADEAREHLQNLNQALLDFEKDTSNLDMVNIMFRSAHTLKGMSATMGFNEVAEVTHKMENLLTPVRTGELKAGGEIVDVLFQCLDALEQMVEAHIGGTEHGVNTSGLVSRLEELGSGKPQAAKAGSGGHGGGKESDSDGYPGTLSDDQIKAAAAAAKAGQRVFHIKVSLDEGCEMRGVRAYMVLAALKGLGTTIASIPSEDECTKGDPGFGLHFLLASEKAGTELQAIAGAVSEVSRVNVRELSEAQDAPVPSGDSLAAFNLNEYDLTLISHSQADGFRLDYVFVRLAEDCSLKSARAFMVNKQIESHGEVVSISPSVEDIEFERFDRDLHFLVVTKAKSGEIKSALAQVSELESVDIKEDMAEAAERSVKSPKSSKAPEPAAVDSRPEAQSETALAPAKAEEAAKAGEASKPAARQSQTIRVDTERLDMLLNMVGELVIGKTRLSQLAREVKRADLADTIEHFGHIVTDLQNIVMQTRMVPIETVFNRFPRMIRDLAKARGKQIELVMTGGETELDRTVVDEIGDPLVHLIRNSLDHGIEPPEERTDAGKSPTGTLTLAAFHEGSHVFIQIRDDGRGIDPEKIKSIALKKGVISAERAAAMTNEEAVMLIFAAGFSTAEQVTDISGRGVGMDVVRTKIESLNGEVKIDTRIGMGTTVTIKLPLTLAIVQALLVDVAGECFAVPLAYIEETLRLRQKDIQKANQSDVYLLRGEILPLVWTKRILCSPEIDRGDESWRVVVVRTNKGRIGLIVDKTLGQTEIVIKTLGHYLANTRYISGGTILGDGTVALILDVVQVGS